MAVNRSGAFELKHCGKIHRASDFSELASWVKELRVVAEDSFRPAGSEEWISVMAEPDFAQVLDPSSLWIVSMGSGEFKAHQFETLVKWAEEGRITDDAVIEGPRTPPGGVRATALPALASFLRKPSNERKNSPLLRIDGREYTAPDTETIRSWIRDSRVPVESLISLDRKNWEPVSSCGLFDLEDWPQAAHGRIEEKPLPEMPASSGGSSAGSEASFVHTGKKDTQNREGYSHPAEHEISAAEQPVKKTQEAQRKVAELPFTVISGDSEIAVESAAKLRTLLRRKDIYSYDELKHASFNDEVISVGEYLCSLKTGKNPFYWVFGSLFIAGVTVSVLELLEVLDIIPWF